MKRVLQILRSRMVRGAFMLVALGAAIWALVTQWSAFSAAVRHLNPFLLLGAGLASLVYVVLTMLAWRALLADMGTQIRPGAAYRIFFVSQLGKYLPGGVWNIVASAELGADHGVSRARSVSAMTVSVVVSIMTGLALAAAMMPFAPAGLAAQYWWTILLLPLFVLALTPPVLNRLLGFIFRLTKRGQLEQRFSWRGMGICVFWTVAAWVSAGIQVWLLALGTGAVASISTFVLCVGGYAMAWTVGFLVVFMPAGAGVREAVLALVLGGTLPAGSIVAVVLLSRVILTGADLLMGGCGLIPARFNPRAKTAQRSS